jgi:hypothetical protein
MCNVTFCRSLDVDASQSAGITVRTHVIGGFRLAGSPALALTVRSWVRGHIRWPPMFVVGSHSGAKRQHELAPGGDKMRPNLWADLLERLQHEAHGTGAALAARLVRRRVGHHVAV